MTSFHGALELPAYVQAPQQKKPKVDASAANGSSTVFVKNLPWSADEDTIAEFFGDCGTVANVRVGEHSDKLSDSSRSINLPATRLQLLSPLCVKREHVIFAGMDRETGKPRGFAHVQFESVEGAAAAIGKNGTELMGRDLFIDSAQERPQSGATPGRQQRGGEPSAASGSVSEREFAGKLRIGNAALVSLCLVLPCPEPSLTKSSIIRGPANH